MISVLSFCFSVPDIPGDIICDNGKQFTSKEYKEFATQWGFTLTTSGPYYPRGHGFIDRQVQTIKNLLSRCDEDGSNHQIAQCELRGTSLDSKVPSSR